MDRKAVILGCIIGSVSGSISPFLMRLSDSWIGGIAIVAIMGGLIGLIGGLTFRFILKNK